MKRFKCLSAILAIILTASLSACGESSLDEKSSSSQINSPEIDKNEPVTVTVWHYYNGVQQMNFDNAVAEFNRTVGYDEGIIVEAFSKGSISELADSVVASVKNSAGAENPPDIFATYAETAYTVDKLVGLVDIGKYFSENSVEEGAGAVISELDEYVSAYIDEGRFSGDGSVKIFPTAKSTEIMILNTTDWKDFAESENITTDDLKTWEGLAEVAEKYYDYTNAFTPDIENDGRAFFGRDSVANYMIVGAKQLGAEFVYLDDSGNPVLTVDKNVVRKLWDNYYVPYVKGCYTVQGRYRSDDVKLGKSIAIICSTTGTAYYPTEVTINDDYSYSIENIVLPIPDFEGSSPYAVQQGAGMSVISSDEQTEYASAMFLKWFTEEERNIEFSINSGYLPVKKSANNFEKISAVNEQSENAVNDTMLNSLELAIQEVNERSLYTMKPFETAGEVRDYLGNYIQNTADSAYAQVLEKIANGTSRDEAVAEFISDDAFDEWFSEFSSSLENIIN